MNDARRERLGVVIDIASNIRRFLDLVSAYPSDVAVDYGAPEEHERLLEELQKAINSAAEPPPEIEPIVVLEICDGEIVGMNHSGSSVSGLSDGMHKLYTNPWPPQSPKAEPVETDPKPTEDYHYCNHHHATDEWESLAPCARCERRPVVTAGRDIGGLRKLGKPKGSES